jgi:integrase
VAESLRQHRQQQRLDRLAAGSRWKDRDYVFASAVGTPLEPRNVLRAFHAALEAAGLPHQPFHHLRHAYATLQLEAGEELANVSKILGHANLSTTADLYAHLTPATHRRAAGRMDAILAG